MPLVARWLPIEFSCLASRVNKDGTRAQSGLVSLTESSSRYDVGRNPEAAGGHRIYVSLLRSIQAEAIGSIKRKAWHQVADILTLR